MRAGARSNGTSTVSRSGGASAAPSTRGKSPGKVNDATTKDFGRESVKSDATKNPDLRKFNTVLCCWDSTEYYNRKGRADDGDKNINDNDKAGASGEPGGISTYDYLIKDKNECVKWRDAAGNRDHEHLPFGPFDVLFWNNSGSEMWSELFHGQVMDLLGEEQRSDPRDVTVKQTKKRHTTMVCLGSDASRKSLFVEDFLCAEFVRQYCDRKRAGQYDTPYTLSFQMICVTQDNKLIDLLNKGKEITNFKLDESELCFHHAKLEELDHSDEFFNHAKLGRSRMVDVNDSVFFYFVWKALIKWPNKEGDDKKSGSGKDKNDKKSNGKDTGESIIPTGMMNEADEIEPTYKSWLIADITPDCLKSFRNIKLNMKLFDIKQFMCSGYEVENQRILQNKAVIALIPGFTGPVEYVTDPIFLTLCDHHDRMSFASLEFSEVFLKFQERLSRKPAGKKAGGGKQEEQLPVPWHYEMASSEIRKRGYTGRFKESMKGLIYEDERIQTSFTMPEAPQLIMMLRDTEQYPDLTLLLNASRTDLYTTCLESAKDCLQLRKDLEDKSQENIDMRSDFNEKEKKLKGQLQTAAAQLKNLLLEKETLKLERDNLQVTNEALNNQIALVSGIIKKSEKEYEKTLIGCYQSLCEAFPDESDANDPSIPAVVREHLAT